MRLSFCCRSVTNNSLANITTTSLVPSSSLSIINNNNTTTSQYFPIKGYYRSSSLTKSDVAGKPLTAEKLGERWREFQGSHDWEGLLDPLDDTLRSEILRYGHFVDSAYRAFDFDPLSPTYATCRSTNSGLVPTGYRVTKHLHATCGVRTPGWIERLPSWMSVRSSWIGYVAVCQDDDEIRRLGRRDVVIALRGTATCLEWLENLRTTLTGLPGGGGGPMVESGFLSLYTSESGTCQSLQASIKEEVARLIRSYGGEPLSLTITGHSLGAALATLGAYDVTSSLADAPMVTVFSFGGPRVGNRDLRCQLDDSGTKILRIVNSDDLVTKVPGFVVDDDEDDHAARSYDVHVAGVPSWIRRRVSGAQGYADVGRELKLSSKKSPYVSKGNLVTCHDLKTYLHLVNGFVSSTCPFKATAEMLSSQFVN